jgi:flagellar biosynthetic protein FliR
VSLSVLVTAGLVFARLGSLIAAMPVISAREIPKHVPILLSAVLAILIAPSIEVMPVESISAGLIVGLAGEILLGAAVGLSVRAVFSAIAMACELASMQMGLAMAAQFNPLQMQQTGPLAILCTWISGGIFLISGLHLRCIEIVAASFQIVPPGTAGLHEAALQSVLLAVGACISLGAQLAGPLILMAWMINVLVGVLGRLAPRMNVFLSIGMTLSSAVGVVLVMLSLPWMMVSHEAALREVVANSWRVISAGV